MTEFLKVVKNASNTLDLKGSKDFANFFSIFISLFLNRSSVEPECSSTNRSSADRSTVEKSSEAMSPRETREEAQKEVIVGTEQLEKSTSVKMGKIL